MTTFRQILWKCDFCTAEETHPDDGNRPKHWRTFTLYERPAGSTRDNESHFACCPACGGPGALYEKMHPIRRILRKLGALKS